MRPAVSLEDNPRDGTAAVSGGGSVDPNENGSTHPSDGDAEAVVVGSETALDWLLRSRGGDSPGSRKRRRSNASPPTDVHTAPDAATAALRFLRFGNSGIAPIDAAWQQQQQQRTDRSRRPLPPVVVLEGPRDVGKTWMLLTLAARFVVATRASRFGGFGSRGGKAPPGGTGTANERRGGVHKDSNNSNTGNTNNTSNTSNTGNTTTSNRGGNKDSRNNSEGPKVLLLDSTYDFSVSQLVSVLRSTLRREREKDRARRSVHPQRRGQQHTEATNGKAGGDDREIGGRKPGEQQQQKQRQHQHQQQHYVQSESRQGKLDQELKRHELELPLLELDMEDCLSRIHIIQVDGSNGWVPTLEALTHRLSEERRHGRTNGDHHRGDTGSSPFGTPTLLLWDGFLSDVVVTDSSSALSMGGSGIDGHSNPHALFDSPVSREILRQVSRLLEEERDALWCVLTARTKPALAGAAQGPPRNPAGHGQGGPPLPPNKYGSGPVPNTGIGVRVAEWIRKEGERRESQARRPPGSGNPGPPLPPNSQRREAHRVLLERRPGRHPATGGEGLPRSAAAAAALCARIAGGGAGRHGHGDPTIPYSLSLGGILS